MYTLRAWMDLELLKHSLRSSTGSTYTPYQSGNPNEPYFRPKNPSSSTTSTAESKGYANVSILETLKNDIARKELELQQLKQAYEIVKKIDRSDIDEEDNERSANEYDQSHPEGNVAPPSQPQVKDPAPPTNKQLAAPRFIMACSACGTEMYRAYKRVPSGITVEYWQCGDSGCNNEMY